MRKFTFLIPLYNDWQNLKILIEKIEIQLQKLDGEFDMVILNDFSPLKCDISFKNLKKINRLKIINFNKNIGSQRAIAIGLKYISQINEHKERKMIQTLLKYDIELYKIDVSGYEDVGTMTKEVFRERKQKATLIDRDNYFLLNLLAAI